MKNNLKYYLHRSVGFMNYDERLTKDLIMDGFKKIDENQESLKYLKSSYHTEYLKIMFSDNENYGVSKFTRELNLSFSITSKNFDVEAKNIEIFCFHDDYNNEQIAIFSIEYNIENPDLHKISDISRALKFNETEINFKNKTLELEDFINKEILISTSFTGEDSLVEQFAGKKFKTYLVLDFDHQLTNSKDLLFELGTASKIGTLSSNNLNTPSNSYKEKIFKNLISCFNNYSCLALLDSFTVIGSNNFNIKDPNSQKTWRDTYYSIYIFNLYVKCTLQVISNNFSENPMTKRREFQNFYNKYYFKKISFNFLPNEIFEGISKSIEVEEDINFINKRLETVAVQVNEKQQKQQEVLLFAISVIALIEIPLHVDGIRKMIGINETYVYNISFYTSLIIILSILLIFISRKNRY